MALFYDFGELDNQLDSVESAGAAQEDTLSNTSQLTPGLAFGLRAAAQRVLALGRECDQSEYIATVLGFFHRREGVSSGILAGRSRRLRAMKTSLRWAIRWGAVKGWVERVRNGWRG